MTLRQARVEILVLIRAEPAKIDPSSDSTSERCIQHVPEANSPSNIRPSRGCRKPDPDTPPEIVIVGKDGK